nr:ester cyclase [Dyadobacter frigoris]
MDVIVEAENTVVVELSLNGTHKGPLQLPSGTIPATEKTMQTPCCDVFKIENGKIKSFHYYTATTIFLKQLGVFDIMSPKKKNENWVLTGRGAGAALSCFG